MSLLYKSLNTNTDYMPFAGFDSFSQCVIHMKEKQGYSEEIAKKVCGKLQAESENGLLEDIDFKLASELQCRIPDLPKESFAYFDDMGGHLPHHGMDGKIKCNCVRAAIQAMGGARTGKPMNAPGSARTHLMAHAKECGIEISEKSAINPHLYPDKEAAILAFAQKPVEFTDMPNGDVVFHNVTLLAEGKWTDKHTRKSIKYSGNELVKGRWEKKTFKAQHDIYDELPVTNEIGTIENEKFVTVPTPRWIGDIRIYPTQLGKDIVTLLKRQQIKGISTEVFHILVPDAAGELQSTEEIFMGAATVRQGACSLCTFNEGDGTTAEYSKEQMKDMLSYMKSHPEMMDDDMKGMMKSMMGGGKAEMEGIKAVPFIEKSLKEGDEHTNMTEGTLSLGTDSAITSLEKQLQDAVESRSSDVAVLSAQLEELKKTKASKAIAELESLRAKVAELEATNKELLKRYSEMEHATKVQELQRQIAELSKQPVIHTHVTGKSMAQASELDEGEWKAFSAKDFGD